MLNEIEEEIKETGNNLHMAPVDTRYYPERYPGEIEEEIRMPSSKIPSASVNLFSF